MSGPPNGELDEPTDPPSGDAQDVQAGTNDGWYYAKGEDQYGPVSFRELGLLACSNQLDRGDLVWKEGMATWEPASSVPNLSFAPPKPPPLPKKHVQQDSADPPSRILGDGGSGSSNIGYSGESPHVVRSSSDSDYATLSITRSALKAVAWIWIILAVLPPLILVAGTIFSQAKLGQQQAKILSKLQAARAAKSAADTNLRTFEEANPIALEEITPSNSKMWLDPSFARVKDIHDNLFMEMASKLENVTSMEQEHTAISVVSQSHCLRSNLKVM